MLRISSIQNVCICVLFFSINFEIWDPFYTNGNFSISKLAGFMYFGSVVLSKEKFFFAKSIKSFLIPIFLFFLFLTTVNLCNINSFSSVIFDMRLFQNIVLFWIVVNH